MILPNKTVSGVIKYIVIVFSFLLAISNVIVAIDSFYNLVTSNFSTGLFIISYTFYFSIICLSGFYVISQKELLVGICMLGIYWPILEWIRGFPDYELLLQNDFAALSWGIIGVLLLKKVIKNDVMNTENDLKL